MKKKDKTEELGESQAFLQLRSGKVYVVCMEHIEDAIDEFVVEFEQSPDIYELGKISFTDWESPDKCEFCEKKPRFLVV